MVLTASLISKNKAQQEDKRKNKPCNVNPTCPNRSRRCECQHGLIMPTIPKCHAIRIEAGSHADDLVTHTNTEYRLPPFVQRGAKFLRRGPTVLRVSGPIGQKEAVESIADGIEIVVPRQNGDRCATPHEGALDVCLGAKVEYSDLDVACRVKHVRLFCGDLINEVFLAWIP